MEKKHTRSPDVLNLFNSIDAEKNIIARYVELSIVMIGGHKEREISKIVEMTALQRKIAKFDRKI